MARFERYEPPQILNPYRDLQCNAEDTSDATGVALAFVLVLAVAAFISFN